MAALIGSLRVSLGLDTAAFSKGLKEAQGKMAAVGAVLRKAVVPITAAGVAALTATGAAVKSSINAADELSKAAAKFGIPIEMLSRLKYAADLSDVSMDTLGTSVGILSKKMVEASRDGTGEAAQAFERLGISVKDAEGNLRPGSEVLLDLSDALAKMDESDPRRAAAAMEMLGRGGKEMIPLLKDGSGAIREMMDEADRFGQVFGAESGAQAEQFNDNLTRLGGAFSALASDLSIKLLPHLSAFTDWLVENGPGIADAIAKVVSLGASFVPVGQKIAEGIKIGGDAIVSFAGFVTEAVQTVADFASSVPARLEELKAGVSAKMAEVAQSFRALVAEMQQIGQDVVDGFLNGLKAKWDVIVSWATAAANSIGNIFRQENDTHSPSMVFDAIGRDLMAGLAQGLNAGMAGVQQDVQGFARDIASSFADVLTGARDWRDALSGVLSSVGGSLVQSGIGGLGKAIGIPGFANGTNSAPGGWAIVGEEGPEMLKIPRGAQVIPNHRMPGAAASPVFNYAPTINAPGASAADLALLRAEMRQQADEMNRTFRDRAASAFGDPRLRGR